MCIQGIRRHPVYVYTGYTPAPCVCVYRVYAGTLCMCIWGIRRHPVCVYTGYTPAPCVCVYRVYAGTLCMYIRGIRRHPVCVYTRVYSGTLCMCIYGGYTPAPCVCVYRGIFRHPVCVYIRGVYAGTLCADCLPPSISIDHTGSPHHLFTLDDAPQRLPCAGACRCRVPRTSGQYVGSNHRNHAAPAPNYPSKQTCLIYSVIRFFLCFIILDLYSGIKFSYNDWFDFRPEIYRNCRGMYLYAIFPHESFSYKIL